MAAGAILQGKAYVRRATYLWVLDWRVQSASEVGPGLEGLLPACFPAPAFPERAGPSHAGGCSYPTPLSAPELLVRVRSVDLAPCWAAFQSQEECPVPSPGRAAWGLPSPRPNGFLFKVSSDILITNRGQPLLSGP